MRLIIFVIIAFIVLKSSTFGWRFWSKSFIDIKEENAQSVERLKRHVYKLADEIGGRSVYEYEQLGMTVRYITDTFRSFGYNVEFQDYSVLDKTVKNIIATKNGIERPEEIVIVGAHYDTCFNPGADDNGSAVAGLLELARFISDKQTSRSIKFIAFVNEEPPFFKTELMGSRIYTKAAKAKGEEIKAALILESIGYYSDRPFSQRYPLLFGLFYPNKGNFIAIVGNFTSRRLAKEVVSNFKYRTQFPIESVVTFNFVPGVDFSDNWSFWKEAYPAVMITDTAFYRNPNYHTSTDLPQTLDYQSLSEVVNGLSHVLLRLGESR